MPPLGSGGPTGQLLQWGVEKMGIQHRSCAWSGSTAIVSSVWSGSSAFDRVVCMEQVIRDRLVCMERVIRYRGEWSGSSAFVVCLFLCYFFGF
jgi:hypothetical protein